MYPVAQPNAQQNVHVDGRNNTVIVAMRDVVIGPGASHLPRSGRARKHKRGTSRRWFGASAGMATSAMMAMLATWALHPPQVERRLNGDAPLADVRAARAPLQPPAVWPDGASALCGDGRFSESDTRPGTCSRHGGVAQWRYAAEDPHWRN